MVAPAVAPAGVLAGVLAIALAGVLAVGCAGGTPAAARRVSDGVRASGAGRAGSTRAVLPRPEAIKLASGVTAIGLAADPAGGYWILKSNGGVAGIGAPTHGSLFGKVTAGAQATAIAAGRNGGYLVLTSDGGVHAFGTPSHGSDLGKFRPGVTAVGLASDPATGGYWIERSDGGVDAFGVPRHGSLIGGVGAGATMTGIAAGRPGGYLVLVSTSAVPAGLGGRVWNVLPTSRKVVALTFDIGPTNGVPSILATLSKDHVRAVFNLVGATVKEKGAIARAIAAAGQVLGDHSMTHPHFTKVSDAEVRAQVRDAQTEIASVTGKDPWPWFRFPYGDDDSRAVALVNSAGFVPIGWTVDTLGWEGTSHGITPRIVVQRVLAARRPGEIVLMHGGSDTGDHSAVDAAALPIVIRDLRADGYSFVTPDVMLRTGTVTRSTGRVAAFGTPWYGSDAGQLSGGVTAVGIAADPATGGYWVLRSDGTVDGLHAPSDGSLAGHVPAGSSVVAIAATATGYLILTSGGRVYAFS
jgi:peptidoglycan/xylan/chitin deacetylase (PgdA/CDA1 family)